MAKNKTWTYRLINDTSTTELHLKFRYNFTFNFIINFLIENSDIDNFLTNFFILRDPIC